MRKPAGNTSTAVLPLITSALADAALGEWTERALCTQADPEIFFPPKGDPGTEAKQICASCPVREECLTYAIEADEKFGIWGGLNRAARLHVRQALESRKPPRRHDVPRHSVKPRVML
jgi:WhiB family transcriptional regulator, redox-sensing transcriptional regulator